MFEGIEDVKFNMWSYIPHVHGKSTKWYTIVHNVVFSQYAIFESCDQMGDLQKPSMSIYIIYVFMDMWNSAI